MIRTPSDSTIGIIGLGYVGLPLAVEFGKKYRTIGFDIKQSRIDELNACHDRTHEVDTEELHAVGRQSGGAATSLGLHFTSTPADLAPCNVFIITVPTPIDRYKRPDLIPLLRASETVACAMRTNTSPGPYVVIYESTVYPGATEEDCVPVLEKHSGLKFLTSTPSRLRDEGSRIKSPSPPGERAGVRGRGRGRQRASTAATPPNASTPATRSTASPPPSRR